MSTVNREKASPQCVHECVFSGNPAEMLCKDNGDRHMVARHYVFSYVASCDSE